jgi:flagellar biosynthesis anti-sigma factor FlgM
VVKVDGNPPLLNRKDVQEIKTVREQKLAGRKGTDKAQKGDEIRLSEKVKLIMKLKEELSLHHNTDTEKIERIKALVKSGKYKISSDLLAEKILEDEFGL